MNKERSTRDDLRDAADWMENPYHDILPVVPDNSFYGEQEEILNVYSEVMKDVKSFPLMYFTPGELEKLSCLSGSQERLEKLFALRDELRTRALTNKIRIPCLYRIL